MSEVKLYLGDCLEILSTPEIEGIDLIFADPPFNIGKPYGGNGNSDKRVDYYEWCKKWITKCFKIINPTGSFYLMTSSRHVFKMGCEMEKHGVFINKIEWRNVGASHNKRCFWSSTQSILLFGKTDDYKFNTYAQKRRGVKLWSKKRNANAKGQLLDYWDDIPYIHVGSAKHPEAILEPGTNRKAHLAQMPIDLAKRAILFSSDPGDLVLDPFMGSGTTGVACVQTGRNFIGIEIDPKYFAIAEKRIAEAQLQIRMEI